MEVASVSKDLLAKVVEKENLSQEETKILLGEIMEGKMDNTQIAALLTALRMKGETAEEIAGAVQGMLEKAITIHPRVDKLIDTCGTGGDGSGTFNISTVVAIIAAACGVPVAKHGNRSVSSQCGSADVLEALGVAIDLSPSLVQECLEEVGVAFIFAPLFHPAMKHVAATRKELGLRTIFNLLGPLINPAQLSGQVLGVYQADLTEKIAQVLAKLGRKRAYVIHGYPGLDEFSLVGETKVSQLIDSKVNTFFISPEDVGLRRSSLKEIQGGNKEENARIIKSILNGESGPPRDIVLFNAAAALVVGEAADNMQAGIVLARKALDSGAAAAKLERLIVFSQFLAERIKRCS